MSIACNKMSSLPIEMLRPSWVQFTKTRGVLRVLKPTEDPTLTAQGMIFKCPKCCHDKEKEHYCIFLFLNAPTLSRPHGRFVLDSVALKHLEALKKPWGEQTLYERNENGLCFTLLKPRDLACGWQGYLVDGKVSWRQGPNERSGLI